MHRAAELPQGVFAAGAVDGVWRSRRGDRRRPARRLARGAGAGLARRRAAAGVAADVRASQISHPWPIFPHPKGKDFVDFDEDLQVKDIVNAIADGYDQIELLKRYSTLGMGPSQGRHSTSTRIRLARARDRPDDRARSARPRRGRRSWPEKFGASRRARLRAGAAHRHAPPPRRARRADDVGRRLAAPGLLRRRRRTPTRADRGGGARPCATSVGMIDVSTLGGLDMRGPDAAEFLDRIYTWAYEKQQVGRARYVLMTDAGGRDRRRRRRVPARTSSTST